MSQLIDPRLRWAIPNIWPSRCTIQSVTVTESASGQPVATGGEDVEGYTDLECILGPIQVSTPFDREVRTSRMEYSLSRRICSVNKLLENIAVTTHQVIADGLTYRLFSIEYDYLKFTTRLTLELITP